MYKIWHKATEKNEEILVRLFDEGNRISLQVVTPTGTPIKKLIDFRKADGLLVPHTEQSSFEYTQKQYPYSVMPFYKIWHDKRKAKVRLRLIEDGNYLYVAAVDKKGLLITASRLIDLSGKIRPCTFVNIALHLPSGKGNKILAIKEDLVWLV